MSLRSWTCFLVGVIAGLVFGCKLTMIRYFSWMGPSSIRRDILSKYRQEKRQLGFSSRGRRGGKRGRRTTKDGSDQGGWTDIPPTRAQPNMRAPNGNKSKDDDYHDQEEEDEFFDAEDASLQDVTAALDELEFESEAVN